MPLGTPGWLRQGWAPQGTTVLFSSSLTAMYRSAWRMCAKREFDQRPRRSVIIERFPTLHLLRQLIPEPEQGSPNGHKQEPDPPGARVEASEKHEAQAAHGHPESRNEAEPRQELHGYRVLVPPRPPRSNRRVVLGKVKGAQEPSSNVRMGSAPFFLGRRLLGRRLLTHRRVETKAPHPAG